MLQAARQRLRQLAQLDAHFVSRLLLPGNDPARIGAHNSDLTKALVYLSGLQQSSHADHFRESARKIRAQIFFAIFAARVPGCDRANGNRSHRSLMISDGSILANCRLDQP